MFPQVGREVQHSTACWLSCLGVCSCTATSTHFHGSFFFSDMEDVDVDQQLALEEDHVVEFEEDDTGFDFAPPDESTCTGESVVLPMHVEAEDEVMDTIKKHAAGEPHRLLRDRSRWSSYQRSPSPSTSHLPVRQVVQQSVGASFARPLFLGCHPR